MEELLPYGSNKNNKKKVDMDTILPFIILPLLLLLSTLSKTVTIIVMVAVAMGVLYVHTRPRQKNRSPFFLSWTLSSGIYLFLVFEFGVMHQLEITQVENFVLLLLVACTCYFFQKMKAVADFELKTGSSKGKEYRWDCCVLRPNYPYFLAGQVFAFAALLFGTNLGLTTVCQPFIFIGTILLPEDCRDVYYQMDLAICFVASVYGVGYLLIIALVLLHQMLVYIPKYSGTAKECTLRNRCVPRVEQRAAGGQEDMLRHVVLSGAASTPSSSFSSNKPQWRKIINVLNV